MLSRSNCRFVALLASLWLIHPEALHHILRFRMVLLRCLLRGGITISPSTTHRIARDLQRDCSLPLLQHSTALSFACRCNAPWQSPRCPFELGPSAASQFDSLACPLPNPQSPSNCGRNPSVMNFVTLIHHSLGHPEINIDQGLPRQHLLVIPLARLLLVLSDLWCRS